MINENYKKIVLKLIEKNITISVAESITGGLISKLITDVPGASNIFSSGYIVYSNEAKIKILNVDEKIITKHGVVSNSVAYDMCEKLRSITNADIVVSTTGNAGPGVCDDKPVGMVYIGICYNNKINVYECLFSGDRNTIREEIANKIFMEIEKILCI